MNKDPKIAIIGAGPGGLILARLLQHHGIPCTVYEGEKSRNVRSQGGTLDIHEGSGQLAIREAGLWDEFQKVVRPEADAMRLCDPSGHAWIDENKKPRDSRDRPEIDRLDLRNMLLDSLEPGSICWGKKLQSVEPAASNTYDLHFQEEDPVTGFDLVVGADGAWSKVRPLVTSVTPFYSGISGVGCHIDSTSEHYAALSGLVGAGSCFVIGDNAAIIAQRNGNGTLKVYAYRRAPESWLSDCGIDWKDAKAAKAELVRRYYDDWMQGYKDLILQSDDELDPRALYMLPIGIEWAPRPGITLLGDAAHLMTPFAGVGVNVAMHDALELARAIIARRQNWLSRNVFTDSTLLAAATRDYEASTFERGEKYARKTWGNLQHFFSEGGIRKIMMTMQGMSPDQRRAAR